MTNDAVKEIKKAEENGAQLIVNARIEAKFRVEQTGTEIEKSKLDAQENFKRVFDTRVAAASEQAQKIVSARVERAQKEADEIGKGAKSNMEKAVDIIIEEIKSLWQ